MSKELTKLKFEVKALNDEDSDYYHIEGIASTPDIDKVGDIVTPEAMIKSFQTYGLPKFPHQHDLNQMPVGVWDDYELRGDVTVLKGRIPRVAENEKLFKLIDMGAYGGLSIGYIIIEAVDQEGNNITRKKNFNGIRIITELMVFETSLVTVPCNEFAKILEIKSADFDPERIVEIKKFYNEQTEGDSMQIENKDKKSENDDLKEDIKGETKNRFENCESLSDIEAVFKSVGLSIKESQTAISKVKANLKSILSDSEEGENKSGVSDSDLQDETKAELSEADYKSISEALNELTKTNKDTDNE